MGLRTLVLLVDVMLDVVYKLSDETHSLLSKEEFMTMVKSYFSVHLSPFG